MASEKRIENTNSVTKFRVGKLKPIAIKNKISPKPKLPFTKFILSFNFEYIKRINNTLKTNNKFNVIAIKKLVSPTIL